MRLELHGKIDLHLHGPITIITQEDKQKEVLEKLNFIIKQNEDMATDLTNLEKEVSENKSVIDSAVVLLKGLKEKLDAAGTDATKLAELSASLDAQSNSLASAVAENTPAE